MILLMLIFLLSLPPTYNEEFDPSISKPDVNYDDFNNNIENKFSQTDELKLNCTTEENCRFKAEFGRLFNESLREKIEIICSNHENKNSKIKVYFDASSEWIIYDEESSLLQGVPMKKFSDDPVHFVMLVFHQRSIAQRLPCFVSVASPTFHQDNHQVDEADDECGQTESVATFAMQLDADLNKLTAVNRIRLLTKVLNFLPFLKSNSKAITLEAGRSDSNNVFLTGQGNAARPRGGTANVYLSWPIACGFDSINQDELEILEEVTQNGSLASLTGYDVIEWRIENRKQTAPRRRRLAPLKRQVGLVHSPFPGITPANASSIPNFSDFSGDKPENENLNFSIDTTPKLQRTSISSPSTTVYKNSPITNPNDDSQNLTNPKTPPIPKTTSDFPSVFVYNRTYFELRVKDILKSSEDQKASSSSSMESMKLSMENFTNCCVQYDGQAIGGFFSGAALSQDAYIVRLTSGENNQNLSRTIKFKILPRPKPYSHRIDVFTSQIDATSKVIAALRFIRRLIRTLGTEGSRSMQPPGRFTFLKISHNTQRLSISWFDNQLNSSEWCNKAAISALLAKLTGFFPKTLTSEQLKAGTDFTNKLKPEFYNTRLKLTLFGPCSVKSKPKKINTSLKPPLIIYPPPFFLNYTNDSDFRIKPMTNIMQKIMTTVQNLTTLSYPESTKKILTITVDAQVGKLTVERINRNIFVDQMTLLNNKNLFLKLLSNSNASSSWLGVDLNTWSLVALPKNQDLPSLPSFNSTHKLWQGKLSVFDKVQTFLNSAFVYLFVSIAPSNVDESKLSSPLYSIKLNNFDVKNFTVLYAQKLLELISELFGDSDTRNVVVRSVEPGSVIVTWTNSSISNTPDACSFAESSQRIFLDNESRLKASVISRFLQAGFKVNSLNWKKPDYCSTTITQTSPLYSSEKHTTKKYDKTAPLTVFILVEKSDSLTIVLIAISTGFVLIFIIILIRYQLRKRNSTPTDQLRSSLSNALKKQDDKQQLNKSFYLNRGTSIIFTEGSYKVPQSSTSNDLTKINPIDGNKKELNYAEPVADIRPPPPSYADNTLSSSL